MNRFLVWTHIWIGHELLVSPEMGRVELKCRFKFAFRRRRSSQSQIPQSSDVMRIGFGNAFGLAVTELGKVIGLLL